MTKSNQLMEFLSGLSLSKKDPDHGLVNYEDGRTE